MYKQKYQPKVTKIKKLPEVAKHYLKLAKGQLNMLPLKKVKKS